MEVIIKHFKNLLTLTLVASALIGSQTMQASAQFFSRVPTAIPVDADAADAAFKLPQATFMSPAERDRVQTKLTRELERAVEQYKKLEKSKKGKKEVREDALNQSARRCRVLSAILARVHNYYECSADLQELLANARSCGPLGSRSAGIAGKRRGTALKAAKSAADKAAAKKLKTAEKTFLNTLNEFIAKLEKAAQRFQKEYNTVVDPVDADGNPMSPATVGMFDDEMDKDVDILNIKNYTNELNAVVAKLKALQDQAKKATNQSDLLLKKQSIVETIQTLCSDHKYKLVAGGILAALGAAGGVLVTPEVISKVVQPALGCYISAAAGYSMMSVAGLVGATTGGATGVVFGSRFDGAPVAGARDPSAPTTTASKPPTATSTGMRNSMLRTDAAAGDDDL